MDTVKPPIILEPTEAGSLDLFLDTLLRIARRSLEEKAQAVVQSAQPEALPEE